MFRILLVVIILYFIARAASRLAVAMRQDSGGMFPRGYGGRQTGRQRTGGRKRATRDEPQEDIEDAKWTDL